MNTPENTTTRIDGKPVSPESEGQPSEGAAPLPSESAAPSAEDQTAKLQAEVSARADLENTRKRLQREKEDSVRYANSSLLEKLLPVVDNFELGLTAARQSTEASAVLSGMGMVQKQLEEFLREQGMLTIDAVGQKFDPNLHEALGEEASDEAPEGVVIRQLRKGYKLKDRLLRPANVFVSKGRQG